ncbi:MAG TPA: hypothetical protein DDW27_15410 [Bacteroidales bacterium]|nr:hypothetical protein [Bacteroidales bacterium]
MSKLIRTTNKIPLPRIGEGFFFDCFIWLDRGCICLDKIVRGRLNNFAHFLIGQDYPLRPTRQSLSADFARDHQGEALSKLEQRNIRANASEEMAGSEI